MPPHHHHHHHHSHRHHWDELPESVWVKATEIQSFLGDSNKDRRLCRFAFHDGPHHRRASAGVISGIALYLSRLAGNGGRNENGAISTISVDFHVPPHLRGRVGGHTGSFELPTRLLTEVFGENVLDEIIDSLIDGPPHDGACNLIVLSLFESIFDSLTQDRSQSVHGGLTNE